MKTLQGLWDAFNGKKTAIGAFLLTFAFALTQIDVQVIQGIWELTTPTWFAPMIKTLEWVGSVFSGVGLIHRAKK